MEYQYFICAQFGKNTRRNNIADCSPTWNSVDFEQASAPIYIYICVYIYVYIYMYLRRGGESQELGETRVERMGGISSGVGGGGGSARLY